MNVDWSELFRSSYEDLVRFLHRHIWDADRAQDLAQEAFVRALRERPPPEKPLAWLFTVAINLVRDEARTAGRRKKHLVLLRAEAELNQSSRATADESLEREERTQLVRQALADLGATERDALLLWDAGLSYEDIAGHTGLSVRSVGTTLTRARKKVAEFVTDMERNDVAHR